MSKGIVARVSETIAAPVAKVWDALVTPELIKQYMFGATVASQWREGAAISWKGEWNGKPYEDKGKILRVQPRKLLQYTHFSPLLGKPDVAENYHTVTVELIEQPRGTRVTLAQDGNATEEARAHSEKNWRIMLDGLKRLLER